MQRQAQNAYARASKDIYSVRVGANYRAIGQRADDAVTWFWIGTHADYDDLIGKL